MKEDFIFIYFTHFIFKFGKYCRADPNEAIKWYNKTSSIVFTGKSTKEKEVSSCSNFPWCQFPLLFHAHYEITVIELGLEKFYTQLVNRREKN